MCLHGNFARAVKEEDNQKMREEIRKRLEKAAKNGKRAVIAVTAGGGIAEQYRICGSGRHRRRF